MSQLREPCGNAAGQAEAAGTWQPRCGDWRRARGGHWWESLAELQAELRPDDRDRVWQGLARECRGEDEALLDGGAAITRVDRGLSILSGGEDCLDALEYSAQRVARVAAEQGVGVLGWHELLP